MAKQSATEDRNFDDLAERFKRNVYGGLKGAIRLAVLQRDFSIHVPIAPFYAVTPNTPLLRILDAGGGQGQFSLKLAQAGHRIVICDISQAMLTLAQAEAEALGVLEQVTFVHCAIQDLPQHMDDCAFDAVFCHAVMEWMLEPHSLLPCLDRYLKPAGYLSLTFYNLHSLIYKNLLRTNFSKVRDKDYGGWRGSLTPINPIEPENVDQWIAHLPYTVLAKSGIRVFHDYILDPQERQREPAELLALELEFSQREPYRSLGRYIHIVARKTL